MAKTIDDLRLIAGGLRNMARYEPNSFVRRVILIAAVAYDKAAAIRSIGRHERV